MSIAMVRAGVNEHFATCWCIGSRLVHFKRFENIS